MIFDKSSNGTDEMKSLLGFIYATNSFDNIKTDINLAERKVKKLIGTTVYDLALEHYLSENYQAPAPDPEDTPDDPPADPPADPPSEPSEEPTAYTYSQLDILVHAIQLPVAYLAVLTYAPHGDLTHSDKGRQIIVTEKEKPAFEWQLERDNKALLSKYHETTDVLLELLDTDFLELWKTTTEYKAIKTLFITSAADFDKIFPIKGSRYLYMHLCPFINEVEQYYIHPIIGGYYDTIKLWKSGAMVPSENVIRNSTLLLGKIQIPLALLTMKLAAERLGVDVLPDGILNSYDSDTHTLKATKTASQEARQEFIKRIDLSACQYLVKLENAMAKINNTAFGTPYIPVDIADRNDNDNKYFRL